MTRSERLGRPESSLKANFFIFKLCNMAIPSSTYLSRQDRAPLHVGYASHVLFERNHTRYVSRLIKW